MGDRLKELARYAGYADIASFAEAAGIKSGTAQKQVLRQSIPAGAAQKYINVARDTGADLNWLLTGRGSPPRLQMLPNIRSQKIQIEADSDARQFDSGPDSQVPLWRISRGPGGAVLLEKSDISITSPIDFKKKKTSFALRVWDDSNSPWLRRGVTVFVDPTFVGADGEWCLFAADTPDISRTLSEPRLGLLLGATATAWRVQQGTEPRELPFAEWPHAWKIAYIRP